MSNFLQKIFKIIRLEVRTSENIANFAPIFPKMAKNIYYYLQHKKPKNSQIILFLANSSKKAKWLPCLTHTHTHSRSSLPPLLENLFWPCFHLFCIFFTLRMRSLMHQKLS